MKYSKYSVVIIGSGIAGLYLAYKLSCANNHKDGILLVTKSKLNESNSRFAQGGIVCVMPDNKSDSISLHVKDTIKSGCGLTDFNVAKFISENSAEVIEDLLKIGVDFDKNSKNKLNFTLEGAHSTPRILHAGGDSTGKVIESTLCEKIKEAKNVDIYEKTMAVELLVDANGNSKGVLTYNSEFDSYEAIHTNAVVLATGGVGQIYKYTTNPNVATGDGIALALSANAKVKHMEFIQFHPTALQIDGQDKMALISEAVRGEGASLINENGIDIMLNKDPRGALAPRDIVARAIYANRGKSYLDITTIGVEKFQKRFPTITQICKDGNVDINSMLIPVAPSAHYCMGGVETKVNGETSINGLYAIGETACTGLHGANRLASNSLLECVVCAYELSKKLNSQENNPPKMFDESIKQTLEEYDENFELNDFDAEEIKSQIREIMWENVGIVREGENLEHALFELTKIEKELNLKRKCLNKEQYEVRNMLCVAKLIAKSALNREETIGAHFRLDYQKTDETTRQINKGDEVFAQ